MSYKQLMKPGGILTAILLGVGLSPTAFGATAANTQVDNAATVDYEVNGSGQTPVPSNTESFRVDIAVIFGVATSDTSAVQVTLSGTDAVTTFELTNSSNADVLFSLAAQNSTLDAFDGGASDSGVDMSNIRVYEDDGDDTFNSGSDTLHNSTSPVEVASGTSLTVFVVADAPGTGTDGDIAVVDLTATAVDSGGTALSNGDVANGTGFGDWSTYNGDTEVVLLEDGGDGGSKANGAEDPSGLNDGVAGDTSAYELLAADIVVTKSSSVIDDTLGGTAYHVPGATIEFTIVVENLGSADATNVSLTDALQVADITYLDDNSAYTGGDIRVREYGTGEAAAANAGQCDGTLNTTTVHDEDADGGSVDEGGDGVLYDDTADEIEVQAAAGYSVPADSCIDVSFQVTIN